MRELYGKEKEDLHTGIQEEVHSRNAGRMKVFLQSLRRQQRCAQHALRLEAADSGGDGEQQEVQMSVFVGVHPLTKNWVH